MAGASGAYIGASSGNKAPANLLARAQRHHGLVAERIALGHAPLHALERDLPLVSRQAIEIGSVVPRESLELVEGARGIERFRVELERGVRRVHAGRTAAALLHRARMGRRVGAEEELGAARGRGLHEGSSVRLALQYRQAVVMWIDAAREDRVAVHEEV